MPKASSHSPLQPVEGGDPLGVRGRETAPQPGTSSPRHRGTQRSIARGFPVVLESSSGRGMSPAVVGAETGAGAGHGADATLLRFVSSLVSSAENALTAKEPLVLIL